MPLLTYSLITILDRMIWVVYILIIIRIFLSWIPMNNNFTDLIYNLTDPILKPFKDFLDKFISLPIDFSPLLLILTLEALQKILVRIIIALTW
ncbi:MAG: YggT family protein [Fusobacterium sp.]|uniref:YggT family protein n=1 Tax=Fusobacterium sp. TaxID=68766 RepID=UPI003FA11621